jgi:hypothetical protein
MPALRCPDAWRKIFLNGLLQEHFQRLIEKRETQRWRSCVAKSNQLPPANSHFAKRNAKKFESQNPVCRA